MLRAAKLRVTNPAIDLNNSKFTFDGHRSRQILRQPYDLRLPIRFRRQSVQSEFASLSSSSEPSVFSHYTSSVASPSSCSSLQLSNWNLTHRHILVLSVAACAAAVSATWLFFSAIPTLLSFKKAAESLEKLMDATREELPETMAAVRLSGMEISDLTMELSDLGQEITQGVRSSTRAVRLAEERLRRLTNMSPPASVQVVAGQNTDAGGPVVARTARSMKDGIVKGRTILQMFFILTGFSRMALKFIANRAKK